MRYAEFPVADLVPYAGNARTHSDDQIAQIAASIAAFGFCNPVIVGEDGVLIAGHGRLHAAKMLGMISVPAIVIDHLTEAQRRTLVIADNKIALNAGWDEAQLARELRDLGALGIDLGLTGFSLEELDDLDVGGLDDDAGGGPFAVAPDADDEAVPTLRKDPVSQHGDVWICEGHRVMCGDSCDAGQVRHLCGGPVDACWTDPPYNVSYETKAGKIANDSMKDAEFRKFLLAAFECAFAMLRPGGAIYVAHSDTEGLNFRSAYKQAGFKLSGCLVWVKGSLVLGRSDYQWRHEPILYGWKPGAAHSWYGGRAKTTVFEIKDAAPLRISEDGSIQFDLMGETYVISGTGMSIETVRQSIIRAEKPSRSADHPTMKPVALVREMVENSTRPGHVVLDLFGGSGSTLVACHRGARYARLMELDDVYTDVIIRRWQDLTGRAATLEGDGRTFDALQAARLVAA